MILLRIIAVKNIGKPSESFVTEFFCFKLTLPDNNHAPAVFTESFCVAFVPNPVSLNFGFPETDI